MKKEAMLRHNGGLTRDFGFRGCENPKHHNFHGHLPHQGTEKSGSMGFGAKLLGKA